VPTPGLTSAEARELAERHGGALTGLGPDTVTTAVEADEPGASSA
jgi:hypothetical protein